MKQIKKKYDQWAKLYDSNINPTRDLDKSATIETLTKIEFRNVLELGCGSGKNTEWLIKKADRVIGLDFSDGMLSLAHKKILSDNIEFIQSDLNNEWPVGDNTFDLITINLTLEHIEDLDHIFTSAYNKLDINGKCFVCELHPEKQLAGSKARFGYKGSEIELDVFQHLESDYLSSAERAGFKLLQQKDWFDDKNEIPRLISFLFAKNK